MANKLNPDSWSENPNNWGSTKSQVHEAYLKPGDPDNWMRIEKFVLDSGFGVEPNPHEKRAGGALLPEFKITWPTPEKKEADYKIFSQACKMIIGTLKMDDETFSASALPNIFSMLAKSSLFTQLYSKKSETQGNTVKHHVETVPALITTNQYDLRERFILRTTAVFHDIGKAFNIGRDQVHYHALIASNVVSWFMDEYRDYFIAQMTKFDRKSKEKIFTTPEKQSEFILMRNQISEIIRLHHVLEQVDKGILDLKVVEEIFVKSKIAPPTYGLFAIADGSSVVPDNVIYFKFLIQNMDHYFRLLDSVNYVSNESEAEEMKNMYANAILSVLAKIIGKNENAQDLMVRVEAVMNEIANTLDSILARSLLSFKLEPSVA